jgi:hypothetical protein
MKCPFFTENPNEDLIDLVEAGNILPLSKVLELDCGNGRNSKFPRVKFYANYRVHPGRHKSDF